MALAVVLLLAALVGLHSCGGEGTDDIFVNGEEGSRSNRLSRILTQTGDAVVVPAYTRLAAQFEALETAAQDFCAQPNGAKLETLQTAWKAAIAAWMEAGVIQFGPVREENRNLRIQFYPDANNNVERSVQQMLGRSEPLTADFLSTQSVPAQGLSGMERLIFEGATPLDPFLDADKGRRRCDLVVAQSTNLRRIGEEVESDWMRSHGNYVDGFEQAGQGSTVFATRDDALEELVNSFITVVERTKNNRLGDPLGVGSSSGAKPDRAESRLSEASLDNVRESLEALQRYYLGGEPGGEGFGFDDFLGLIGETALDQRIQTQFTESITTARSIRGTLTEALADPERKPVVDQLYNDVTSLTRLIKNDLAIAAGVLVGFNENDGD